MSCFDAVLGQKPILTHSKLQFKIELNGADYFYQKIMISEGCTPNLRFGNLIVQLLPKEEGDNLPLISAIAKACENAKPRRTSLPW
jgi:hypothetical protein